jgi:hypothetical protein
MGIRNGVNVGLRRRGDAGTRGRKCEGGVWVGFGWGLGLAE